jgi:EAL domain-containing protein (putative c-di-GMP-specific phosphodiesterase class I)
VPPGFTVALNLSPLQLADSELITRVARSIERWGISAGDLCFEITETALVENTEGALARLHRLSDLGVRLALDDFGTGYSALNYLRLLPVDVVKIDRSFVANIADDTRDRSIVAGVVDLLHTLGLVVVAEGVETDDQLAVLRSINCDVAQGFLLFHPGRADDVISVEAGGLHLIQT